MGFYKSYIHRDVAVCVMCKCRRRYDWRGILPDGWQNNRMGYGLLCKSCRVEYYDIFFDQTTYWTLEKIKW